MLKQAVSIVTRVFSATANITAAIVLVSASALFFLPYHIKGMSIAYASAGSLTAHDAVVKYRAGDFDLGTCSGYMPFEMRQKLMETVNEIKRSRGLEIEDPSATKEEWDESWRTAGCPDSVVHAPATEGGSQ